MRPRTRPAGRTGPGLRGGLGPAYGADWTLPAGGRGGRRRGRRPAVHSAARVRDRVWLAGDQTAGMSWLRELSDLCRVRGGPVHVGVGARLLEIPERRIRRATHGAGWRRAHHDVVVPPGTPMSPWGRAAAAIAQLQGPDPAAPAVCALARWSGAELLGVGPGAPSRVQVLVPAARRPRPDAALTVLRARGFTAADVSDHRGLPVACASWLVRSAAAVASVPLLTDLVIDLRQRGHLDLARLRTQHDGWERYPGRGRVEEVLTRLEEAGRTDAGLELRTRRGLTGAGVPLDRGQVPVVCGDGGTVHLDLGIAVIRFGIDLDSMLAHSSREQLRADVARSNALASVTDDWRVVRGTWEDLDHGWPEFLDLVRRVVSEQSQRYLGRPWPLPGDLRRA